MDISINRNTNIQKPGFNQTAPASKQEAKLEKPALSITNAPASIDDGMDMDVPDDALTRNDPLGTIIDKAFNLPAPPMPKFD